MLDSQIEESEKLTIYKDSGHYEERIHMEGQRQCLRKILNLFPTE